MAKEPFAARLPLIWRGAIFYWRLKGLKGKFSEQLVVKYDNRNFWTGYVFSMIAVTLMVYFLFVK